MDGEASRETMSLDGGRFRGAPATAVVTAVTVMASTMARMSSARWTSVEAWAIETSMERGSAHRAWATLARAFGFCASTGEFLVGTSLLSSVGTRAERASGTRRFLGVLAALMVVSVVVNWTLGVDAEKDACGPFALVFGLLRVYATETPSAPTRDDARGFVITDMMVKYFGACVLAASNRGRSMRAALVGTFAGYVVTDGIGTTHEALTLTSPRWWPRRRSRPIVRMRARVPLASANDAGGLVPPSEENVRVLTSMGFDEAAARRALQRANDDVQRASDFLLSG